MDSIHRDFHVVSDRFPDLVPTASIHCMGETALVGGRQAGPIVSGSALPSLGTLRGPPWISLLGSVGPSLMMNNDLGAYSVITSDHKWATVDQVGHS